MKTIARMMLTTLLCTQALGDAATPKVVDGVVFADIGVTDEFGNKPRTPKKMLVILVLSLHTLSIKHSPPGNSGEKT